MLTKFQVEPPVQGIDAQSKDLWCDMKFNARFVAVRDVRSSTIVFLWHPHPFELGEAWDEIKDEGPQHHSWSQRVPLGVGLAAADGGGGATAWLKAENSRSLPLPLDVARLNMTLESAKE